MKLITWKGIITSPMPNTLSSYEVKTVLIVSILNTKRSDICDFSPFVATQQKKKCICHHLLHFNLTGLHCKSTNTSIILSTSPSPSHNAESSICCWSFVRDWSSSQHCSSEKNTKQSKICLIVPHLWRQCVSGRSVKLWQIYEEQS